MKKLLKCFIAVLMIFMVGTFFGCSNVSDSSESESESIKNYGSICGKVQYSNSENNSEILLTLEATDGLRSVSVNRAIESRNIFNARSIVSSKNANKDGSYIFENLAEGSYTVYASSQNSSERAVCTNVVVVAGRSITAPDLNLTATGSISGKVILDSTDSGNIGFMVFVAGTNYMAMTDDDGSFEISGIPEKSGYKIVVTKGSLTYVWTSISVSAGEDTNLGIENFTSEQISLGVKNGTDGEDGENGKDGTSITWLGSFDSETEIENPKYLDAYFNKKDGCSYIYIGTKWELLARAGREIYSIKYVLNGGEFLDDFIPLKRFDYNEKVELPKIDSLVCENYVFIGWYEDENFQTPISGWNANEKDYDVTVYAKWKMSVSCSVSELSEILENVDGEMIDVKITDSSIDITELRDILKNRNAKVNLDLSDCTDLTSIPDNAFYFEDSSVMTSLCSIILPSQCSAIGKNAFHQCKYLSYINLENVITIGADAFHNSYSLKNVVLSNSMVEIGHRAFAYAAIQSIVIPDSVKSIGTYAFRSCRQLKTVEFGNGVEFIGSWAFSYCSAMKSITIPTGIKKLENTMFKGCTSLEEVNLGNLEVIDYNAFQECTHLTSITIPASVNEVYTFLGGCTNLKNVVFEDTENWYYSKTTDKDKTAGTLKDVSDFEANAALFRTTFSGNYFYKK